MNRNPITRGQMPNHAEPTAIDEERCGGRLALPE
jgi:hypothetical protein